MKDRVRRFIEAEDGVTQIEYALLGVLVALAIVVGASSLGDTMSAMYGWIAERVTTVLS
jgi:pilus assembly protein Flp/PilA